MKGHRLTKRCPFDTHGAKGRHIPFRVRIGFTPFCVKPIHKKQSPLLRGILSIYIKYLLFFG